MFIAFPVLTLSSTSKMPFLFSVKNLPRSPTRGTSPAIPNLAPIVVAIIEAGKTPLLAIP